MLNQKKVGERLLAILNARPACPYPDQYQQKEGEPPQVGVYTDLAQLGSASS